MVDEDEVLRAKRESTRHMSSQERDGLDYPLYQDSSKPPDAMGTDPADGLPRPIPGISMEDSMAPPLSVERLVCMADVSEFVVRDQFGNVTASYKPEQVTRSVSGSYWAAVRGVSAWVQICVTAVLMGATVVLGSNLLEPWWLVVFVVGMALNGLILWWFSRRVLHVKVEPKRPQCRHYVRQLIPWHEDKEHTTCQRYCSALKNDMGEILSISNQEVLACEIRRPRNLESEKLLDDFDAELIRQGHERGTTDSEFDVDAALEDYDSSGGIF